MLLQFSHCLFDSCYDISDRLFHTALTDCCTLPCYDIRDRLLHTAPDDRQSFDRDTSVFRQRDRQGNLRKQKPTLKVQPLFSFRQVEKDERVPNAITPLFLQE